MTEFIIGYILGMTNLIFFYIGLCNGIKQKQTIEGVKE